MYTRNVKCFSLEHKEVRVCVSLCCVLMHKCIYVMYVYTSVLVCRSVICKCVSLCVCERVNV